jgi:hypothetical protein
MEAERRRNDASLRAGTVRREQLLLFDGIFLRPSFQEVIISPPFLCHGIMPQLLQTV